MLFHIAVLSLASLAAVRAADSDSETSSDDSPWATFPSVPKTASINGFADRIYDLVPECAQDCLTESTGNTPCPYWDTGCLCVMPQFAGNIGNCVAENCRNADVGSFESLATSLCSSAGVWEPYWFIPASVSEVLAEAATGGDVEIASTDDSSATGSESAPETTSAASSTSGSSSATAESGSSGSSSAFGSSSSSAAANVGQLQAAGSLFAAGMIGLAALF
ncbi:Repressed by TUP1 protein 5 [Candida viswanathii]|uniref:Repressed by TUP1 protein 5 n=1 Tax=Candida viswanathii TaxID=5486 RepID=A0A367Y2U2_9ASCO|nr:Repressed by TUP1 protein 5 [Candida viswanathii]